MNNIVAGRDYRSVRTKIEAIQFLKRFWTVSALRKIPKRNLLCMYNNKMQEVLGKRGSYVRGREEIRM